MFHELVLSNLLLHKGKELAKFITHNFKTELMYERKEIKIFEDKKVRTLWDEDNEKLYLSITDIIAILTESIDPLAYWRKLKQRIKEEGNETVTNCHALKMQAADGKMRMTDVADTEQLFRLIQSIPSPKAEPFKLWLAQVATEIPKEIFIKCKDDLGIFILFQRINKFRTFTSLENILKLNELVPTL